MSSSIEALQQRLEQVEAERDALAAQLNAVFGAVLRPFVETFSDTEAMAEARRIAMRDPLDILARRDARVKAEAAMEMSLRRPPGSVQRSWMQEVANEYRQQAEGGGDE